MRPSISIPLKDDHLAEIVFNQTIILKIMSLRGDEFGQRGTLYSRRSNLMPISI